jgi:hypothetical protein
MGKRRHSANKMPYFESRILRIAQTKHKPLMIAHKWLFCWGERTIALRRKGPPSQRSRGDRLPAVLGAPFSFEITTRKPCKLP